MDGQAMPVGVDNDILIKMACYNLLFELAGALGGPGVIRMLGTARFVVGKRLATDQRIVDRVSAEARWREFSDSILVAEPSDAAIGLATQLESSVQSIGLELDTGESLLVAMVVEGVLGAMATGDKRAIRSLALVAPSCDFVVPAFGRIVCLEQVIEIVLAKFPDVHVGASICGERSLDKALASCFGCHGPKPGHPDVEGIRSYIDHLQQVAPNVLRR